MIVALVLLTGDGTKITTGSYTRDLTSCFSLLTTDNSLLTRSILKGLDSHPHPVLAPVSTVEDKLSADQSLEYVNLFPEHPEVRSKFAGSNAVYGNDSVFQRRRKCALGIGWPLCSAKEK